jgi:Tfp pilus assembly protein PilN
MIQLNLLPDIKLEYIKAERTRRLVSVTALLVTAASVGLLVILLSVSGLQKKHIKDLSEDIKSESSELQKKPQIAKVLTVQNQLGSLTDLHAAKPAASRLFDFLNQVTPVEVDITNLDIKFTEKTVTITGTADALSSVNKYIDTLKFTTYRADKSKSTPAFSGIVLSSFGLTTGASQNNHPANYTVTLLYDEAIFDITQKISLSVPTNKVTTRSEVDQPKDLFQPAPVKSTEAN